MKKLCACALLVAFMLSLPMIALAEEKKDTKTGVEQPMMEMGAPKEMKSLEKMLGSWKTVTKARMDPAQEWTSSEGQATFEMIMDGCVLRGTYNGQVTGMPFNGLSLISYNRETKMYQSYWVDNMMGMASFHDGKVDDKGNVTYSGVDMFMGRKVYSKMIPSWVNPDTYAMEFQMSNDGTNYFKSMEVTHTRVK